MCLLHLKRCLEVAGGEKEVVSAEFILAVWGDEYRDELCVGLGGTGKRVERK